MQAAQVNSLTSSQMVRLKEELAYLKKVSSTPQANINKAVAEIMQERIKDLSSLIEQERIKDLSSLIEQERSPTSIHELILSPQSKEPVEMSPGLGAPPSVQEVVASKIKSLTFYEISQSVIEAARGESSCERDKAATKLEVKANKQREERKAAIEKSKAEIINNWQVFRASSHRIQDLIVERSKTSKVDSKFLQLDVNVVRWTEAYYKSVVTLKNEQIRLIECNESGAPALKASRIQADLAKVRALVETYRMRSTEFQKQRRIYATQIGMLDVLSGKKGVTKVSGIEGVAELMNLVSVGSTGGVAKKKRVEQ